MLKQMAGNLEQPTEIQNQEGIDQQINAHEEGGESKKENGSEQPSALSGANGLDMEISPKGSDPTELNKEKS